MSDELKAIDPVLDSPIDVATAGQARPSLSRRISALPIPLILGAIPSLVRIRLPIDAPAEARAAQASREAAYEELRGVLLAALHDAESGRLGLGEARANVDAASARARAARMLLSGELARLETDANAVTTAVLALGREIAAERAHRRAAVDAARARVRASRAAGWPRADVVTGAAKRGDDS